MVCMHGAHTSSLLVCCLATIWHPPCHSSGSFQRCAATENLPPASPDPSAPPKNNTGSRHLPHCKLASSEEQRQRVLLCQLPPVSRRCTTRKQNPLSPCPHQALAKTCPAALAVIHAKAGAALPVLPNTLCSNMPHKPLGGADKDQKNTRITRHPSSHHQLHTAAPHRPPHYKPSRQHPACHYPDDNPAPVSNHQDQTAPLPQVSPNSLSPTTAVSWVPVGVQHSIQHSRPNCCAEGLRMTHPPPPAGPVGPAREPWVHPAALPPRHHALHHGMD